MDRAPMIAQAKAQAVAHHATPGLTHGAHLIVELDKNQGAKTIANHVIDPSDRAEKYNAAKVTKAMEDAPLHATRATLASAKRLDFLPHHAMLPPHRPHGRLRCEHSSSLLVAQGLF
jgi:hypothetical protein